MASTSHNPYKDNGNNINTTSRRAPLNMSTTSSQEYVQDGGNNNNNNDTFLSRIFGLNSIYNQLEENYRYYDPEVDSSYQQEQRSRNDDIHNDYEDDEDESLLPHQQNIPMNIINDPTSNVDDANKSNSNNKKTNSLLNSDSDSDLSSSEDSYVRPSLPQQSSDNQQKIKFLLPERAKNLVGKLKHPEPTLPMYQTHQQFRRQPNQRLQQAQLQASNSNYRRINNNRNRFVIPPKERALYLWANITNMDEFLSDVYYYYRGKGILNIVLTRTVDLLILVFILVFTVFLKWGINYSLFFNKLQDNNDELQRVTLSDLIIPHYSHNIPLFIKFLLFGFSVYIVLRVIQLYFDYNYKLKEVKNFYHYLLNVSDDELMTISWKTIVERLMLLKDYNSLTSTSNAKSGRNTEHHYINDLSSKVRLNAHDIANRIMRRENYMIALINKDVLDLSVLFMNEKTVLTKTLEWNLKLCIDNFIYNRQGQINGKILKEYNRNHLARELTSRFKLAAIINLILSPFIVIYFVLLYFFRYFNEYKSNPASIVGLRQYTPYAEWKLREFNELPHFFTKRLVMSMGPANTYIDQFPKGFLVVNAMKLVNFISGSILAVLVIMGILLEDESHSFWSFEITEGKSALFYILIFGTIWAITASSAGESPHDMSNQPSAAASPTFVYDPEASLRYVAQFTHYLPASWNKKLHTIQVKNEFCELYSLKIIIILHEILSLVLTPYILWAKVSQNSGAIIDFFREYSIHVDGLGYVCYFAMFNFEEKDKNMMIANKKKNRKKYQKKSMRKTVRGDNDMPKISKSELERSDSENSDDYSDESDEAVDYLSTLHDQKMINLYIHFNENYSEVKRVNKPVDKDPLQAGATMEQQSLNSSIYDINYKFDDSGILQDDMNASTSRRKGGVLGMLNQFYKQDINRQ